MSEMKIYLAGYIQGKVIEECISWRKKLRQHYDNWKGENKRYPINWIDPLNGENFLEISPDGLKGSLPPHTIVHKDYKSIEICDLVIVNMDTFEQQRPLIGTICELAWAWDKHKPIIMITDDHIYKNHPFLEYFTSWYVSSVDELIEKKIINEFYKAWNSAQY
jgi:nucleoside 2-deoxyribosyltransferase